MEKEFISERQAALLLKVHAATLKFWRDKHILDDLYIEKQTLFMKRIFYKKNKFITWAKVNNLL